MGCMKKEAKTGLTHSGTRNIGRNWILKVSRSLISIKQRADEAKTNVAFSLVFMWLMWRAGGEQFFCWQAALCM